MSLEASPWGWGRRVLSSRALSLLWDSALNPELSASPFSLLLLIFPAKSLCAPVLKEKIGCPVPHLHLCKCLLEYPDYLFFSFWFCDQKLWLSLC